MNATQIYAEVLKTLEARATVAFGPLFAVRENATQKRGLPSQVINAQAVQIAQPLEGSQVDKNQGVSSAVKTFMGRYRSTLLDAVEGWEEGTQNVKNFAVLSVPSEEKEGPGLTSFIPNTTDIAEGVGNVLSDVRTTATTLVILLAVGAGLFWWLSRQPVKG